MKALCVNLLVFLIVVLTNSPGYGGLPEECMPWQELFPTHGETIVKRYCDAHKNVSDEGFECIKARLPTMRKLLGRVDVNIETVCRKDLNKCVRNLGVTVPDEWKFSRRSLQDLCRSSIDRKCVIGWASYASRFSRFPSQWVILTLDELIRKCQRKKDVQDNEQHQ